MHKEDSWVTEKGPSLPNSPETCQRVETHSICVTVRSSGILRIYIYIYNYIYILYYAINHPLIYGLYGHMMHMDMD